MNKKIIVIGIILIFLLTNISVISAIGKKIDSNKLTTNLVGIVNNEESETWALSFGANIFNNVLANIGWKEDHVKFVSSLSSIDEINSAFRWLQQNVKTCDIVLIITVAHGSKGMCSFYSYRYLDNILDSLKCESIFIIQASCYSGSAIPFLQQDGRVIITAASEDSTVSFFGFSGGFTSIGDTFGDKNGVTSASEIWNRFYSSDNPQFQNDHTGDLFVSKLVVNGFPDQYQIYYKDGFYSGPFHKKVTNEYSYRQSFKPSFSHLSKIIVHLGERVDEEISNINNVNVKITNDAGVTYDTTLSGDEFTYKYISDIYGDSHYSIFTLNELMPTTPDETYYIEISTTGDNCVEWWGTSGVSNYYPRGEVSVSADNGLTWESYSNADFDFVTFGFDVSRPPTIPVKPSGSIIVDNNNYFSFSTSTVDIDGDRVYYLFDWGDGTDSGWIGPIRSGSIAEAYHKWTKEGEFYIKVKAKDSNNVQSSWSTPLKVRTYNNPPQKPIVVGPLSLTVKREYEYELSTTDDDGDAISFLIDWGDQNTDLIGIDSGESIILKHIWNEEGNYLMKIRTYDRYGGESEIIEYNVKVSEFSNNPPPTPDKPIYKGSSLSGDPAFKFKVYEDPEGDEFEIGIDWGDDTEIQWANEKWDTASIVHKYENPGIYQIKAKAKDIYNAESEWSEALDFDTSKSKTKVLQFNLIGKILDLFPLFEQILQRLSILK